MKRRKAIRIAGGLGLGLLLAWTVADGAVRVGGSPAEHSEDQQAMARKAQEVMAAQREQLRELRAERQLLTRAPRSTPRRSGSASGLTPAFNPTDRSLTLDGDIELGAASNVSKGGVPWLWTDDAFNLGVGLNALASTTGGSNTGVGYFALYDTTSGSYNTAVGVYALQYNVDGYSNTAVGTAALSANTSSGNTAVGDQALFYNTVGSENTAVGGYALKSNYSGYYNTAIGWEALWGNTSGYRNTAVGSGALEFNTIGSDNTAVGTNALRNTTETYEGFGAGNTAVGSYALSANEIGERNVAVGQNALAANLDISFLTAVGYAALKSNTTVVGETTAYGLANTAIGAKALEYNTVGSFNTANGYHALRGNVDGSFNTASGWQALEMSSSQQRNSAFGSQALRSNYQGSGNTAIGYKALYSTTTGQENTAVGARALDGSDGSYNIAIGIEAGTAADIYDLNILIGNPGMRYDQQTIRLGDQGLHVKTYVAGITGVTLAPADPAVCINVTTGQLGLCGPVSSRRFKHEIRDMGAASERLSELRPVTFRFKEESEHYSPGVQFGLIAEEVAEIFPQLVVYDQEGRPFTLRYELLTPMLLNELQRQGELLHAQKGEIAALRNQLRTVAAHGRELAALQGRLDRLDAARLGEARPALAANDR